MTDPVIPTPITELPPAPLVTDTPEQFDDKAFPLAAALDGMRDGMNSAASAAYQNAVASNERAVAAQASQDFATTEANRATAQANAAMGYRDTASAHATTATTQAGIATTQAGAASSAQTAAQLSAAAAAIDAQRAEDAAASISDGPVTSVNGKTGVVSLVATDIAPAATPQEMLAGTETAYRSMSPALAAMAGRVVRDARTAAVVLTSADKGKLIDITAGTFTQTFASAATLGDGWWCYLQNSGTGDITLDPNASELIDGLTSYIMYPGECRLVQCDGEVLRTIVVNAFYKVFTSSANWIKPPGYRRFDGEGWGGGAGAHWYSRYLDGDRYTQMSGAGGGHIPFSFAAGELQVVEPVVIGAAGVFVAVYENRAQTAGGDTTFAGLIAGGASLSGTGGGKVYSGLIPESNPNSYVVSGGSGNMTAYQFAGTPMKAGTEASPTQMNVSVHGGAGAVGLPNNLSQASVAQPGNFSYFGGGGGAILTGVRGKSVRGGWGADANNAAQVPGGGGYASADGTYGNGARGELRIWGII